MKGNAPAGFTVVEMVVSVFVASLFALSLIGLFTTFNYFTAKARQLSVADNLTYNYLERYTSPDVHASDWFTCDSSTDRTVNPTANKQIASGAPDPDSVGLPTPVNYTISAYAPFGCAGNNVGSPIMVQATVTYGSNATVVTHAGYAAGVQ